MIRARGASPAPGGGAAPGTVSVVIGGLLAGFLAITSVLGGAARLLRALLGGWSTLGERIGRVLRGSGEHLTADELDRARRWAAVAPDWYRLQLLTVVGRNAAVALCGALVLLVRPSLLGAGVLVGVALMAAVSVPARLQLLRRSRGFAETLARLDASPVTSA